jgi:hypothetical protein
MNGTQINLARQTVQPGVKQHRASSGIGKAKQSELRSRFRPKNHKTGSRLQVNPRATILSKDDAWSVRKATCEKQLYSQTEFSTVPFGPLILFGV